MAIDRFSTASHRTLSARTTPALRIAVALALAAACAAVSAQSHEVQFDGDAMPAINLDEPDGFDLERIFWRCDDPASTESVGGPEVGCASAEQAAMEPPDDVPTPQVTSAPGDLPMP